MPEKAIVFVTFPCIKTNTSTVGSVVINAAAIVAPIRPRSVTPVPPAIVCKANGSVFIA